MSQAELKHQAKRLTKLGGIERMIAKIVRLVADLFASLEEKVLNWVASYHEPENPEECEHEWFVVSTATHKVDLILECYKCMSYGVVEDPSENEWETAFDAPSKSYRWHENLRVKYVGTFRNK